MKTSEDQYGSRALNYRLQSLTDASGRRLLKREATLEHSFQTFNKIACSLQMGKRRRRRRPALYQAKRVCDAGPLVCGLGKDFGGTYAGDGCRGRGQGPPKEHRTAMTTPRMAHTQFMQQLVLQSCSEHSLTQRSGPS